MSESEAHARLTEWGIPTESDGKPLTLCQRIDELANDRDRISEQLAEAWMFLDEWARRDIHDTNEIVNSCRSLLKNQQCPGWKDNMQN